MGGWILFGIVVIVVVAVGTALVIRNNKRLFGEIDKKINDLLDRK